MCDAAVTRQSAEPRARACAPAEASRTLIPPARHHLPSSRHRMPAPVSALRSSIALLALCAACAPHQVATSASPGTPGTLVAIFAHPDDESIVSPALARYAREGTKVYVVVATDGRKGVSPHAKIPGGDSLATVRAGEARCSANA